MSTKEQEAQQAQTIAEIRQRHEIDCHWIAIYGSSQLMSDLSTVLEIVGSQAQKIAELKADKSGLNIALEIEATETDVLRQKIKEQAKEIERLKSLHKVPCSHCDATGGFNVESTGEIITCERCNGSGYHLVTPEQTTDSKEVTR